MHVEFIKAEEEGRNAASKGDSITTNPYGQWDACFDHWRDGWKRHMRKPDVISRVRRCPRGVIGCDCGAQYCQGR